MDGNDHIGGNKPLSKIEEDRTDLANEMAGRDVGRIERFLPEGASPRANKKRKERERERLSRLLQLLQSDPEYAALYEDTMSRLRDAENATAQALTQATKELHTANDELSNTMDRANRLSDGTRVFKDLEGRIRNKNGDLIDGEVLDQIVWRDDAPTYEEFLAKKKAAEQAQHNVDAILRYQVDVLGNARQRLTDEDNPPTKGELKDIQNDIDSRVPEIVKKHDPAQFSSAAPVIKNSASVDIPKL